jgi:hypothetical protein
VWKWGLHAALTWIIAGTSSSQSTSYSGYQERSASGGPSHQPPDGSGLRLAPTKPISSTHRRSSSTDGPIGAPGDWGSWHTGAKLSG